MFTVDYHGKNDNEEQVAHKTTKTNRTKHVIKLDKNTELSELLLYSVRVYQSQSPGPARYTGTT